MWLCAEKTLFGSLHSIYQLRKNTLSQFTCVTELNNLHPVKQQLNIHTVTNSTYGYFVSIRQQNLSVSSSHKNEA